MSPEIVVDTSVAFKWFVAYGESGLEAGAKLLQAHRAGELRLIAPATIRVELANTLRHVLASDDALGLLGNFEGMRIGLFDITADLVRRAVSRAEDTGIGVCDALFLALAEQRDCPLVTADRKAFARVETPIEIRLL